MATATTIEFSTKAELEAFIEQYVSENFTRDQLVGEAQRKNAADDTLDEVGADPEVRRAFEKFVSDSSAKRVCWASFIRNVMYEMTSD